jgi:hypothetical protein
MPNCKNNKIQSRLKLILIFGTFWLTYAIAANFATILTSDDFARVAHRQPPSTVIVHDAGWPISFAKEYYSLKFPNVTFEVDYPKLAINVCLVVVVQAAVIFLAWDARILTIRHLLLITATVGVAATLALSAAKQFGGTATYYFVLFAYLGPVPLAIVRLLFQLVGGALWLVRLFPSGGTSRET